MKNANMLKRIVYLVLMAVIVMFVYLQINGKLSVYQMIIVMIGIIAIIVYLILEKVVRYIRAQEIIIDLEYTFYAIKSIHQEKYKALLNGKKKESRELEIEFEEESEELIWRCKRHLKNTILFDSDQLREIEEIINMTERLQKDIFVR